MKAPVTHPRRAATRITATLAMAVALFAIMIAAPPHAETAPEEPPEESIVSGLSQSRVSITASFEGSEILVYGAIKRDAPAPEAPLDIVITVEGPAEPVTIRRKDRVAGIWINNATAAISSAPSFYAVASTSSLGAILSETDNLRHAITIDQLIRTVGVATQVDMPEAFVDALVRIRRGERRYRRLDGGVQLVENTLFHTEVALPANLTEGRYNVRIFLLRHGHVIAHQDKTIRVRKEGIERFVFNLAFDEPLSYGILSLLIAAVAGWGASAAFRLLRL